MVTFDSLTRQEKTTNDFAAARQIIVDLVREWQKKHAERVKKMSTAVEAMRQKVKASIQALQVLVEGIPDDPQSPGIRHETTKECFLRTLQRWTITDTTDEETLVRLENDLLPTLGTLAESCLGYQDELGRLAAALEEAQDNAGKRYRENKRLRQEKGELRQEIATLQADKKRLEAAATQHDAKLGELRTTLTQEHGTATKALNDEIISLREQLGKKVEEITQLKGEINDQNGALVEAGEEIDRLNKLVQEPAAI